MSQVAKDVQDMMLRAAGICPKCAQKKDDIAGYVLGIMCGECADKAMKAVLGSMTPHQLPDLRQK